MGGILLMLRSLTAVGAGVLHRRCVGSLRLVTPGLAYRQLARQSIPYFLISVLAVIHMKADIPMVRMMRGTVELGLYGLAAMVANAAASGIRPLVAPLFPAVAREGGAGTILYPSRALRTLLVPLATGTVVAVAIFVLAGPLIRSWMGPDYAGSIRPLRILAWFVPMIFVSTTALRMMMACGKTGPTIRILAVNGVINIGANALLIPHAGITGAAMATVLSTTASALQSVVFIARLPAPAVSAAAGPATGRTP
jgi:O-antigen/teichoic acid export membrane protein